MRNADARFVLAHPVRTAAVSSAVDHWSSGLRDAGVEVTVGLAGSDPVDLAVTTPNDLAVSVASGARSVIVPGRARMPPGTAADRLGRFLVRTVGTRPRLIVPLGDASAIRSGLATTVASSLPSRWLRRVAVAAATVGLAPAAATITVVQRNPGHPFVLGVAQELGADPIGTWALSLGDGDDLQRAVFHVIPEGGKEPAWVVKFARVPGYRTPFDADQRALATLSARAPGATRHAPSFLGRSSADGHELSVETAARGQPMNQVLAAARPGPAGHLLVDRVARWTIDLAAQSAAPPSSLGDERRRLRTEVAPSRTDHPRVQAAMAIIDAEPRIPAVVQHNDLGSWNIVTDGSDFTVLDWESAVADGFPLWDLVYFLADALSALDGPSSADETVQRMAALFRGDSARSEVLFGHVRDAVNSLGVPEGVVGAIVTMCWVHHGRSHALRRQTLATSETSGDTVEEPPLGRFADVWLDDPALGPGWDRWRSC